MLPPVLVLTLAAFVYSRYGLDAELGRSNAVYLYGGQKMAEGIPPYVSIFDVITPLGPMLAGLGVTISEWLNWSDITAVRLVFLVTGCFAVTSIYLLANSLFQSQRVGGFAALTFLGFAGFARELAGGPSRNVPMVLFMVLNLLLTSRRSWFWAGLCGSLSFLVWQPAAIFPLTTLFLAAIQPRTKRLTAIVRVLIGIILPLVAVGMYFLYHGALYSLLDGAILFHVFYGNRGEISLLSRFLGPVRVAFEGYATMSLPILIGFVMVASLYFSRWVLHGSLGNIFTKDSFAPILVSLPAVVVWSLLDFQNHKDFFILLPYAALGFGWFLELAVQRREALEEATPPEGMQRFITVGLCVSLIALALANSSFGAMDESRQRFDQQRQRAAEIESSLGSDVKLVSIGAPQVLVLQHRTNPNPYAFIIVGIDKHLAANTPGGFEGWLGELQAYDPDVVALGETSVSEHEQELKLWLNSNYREEYSEKQGEPWTLYVKKTLPEVAGG